MRKALELVLALAVAGLAACGGGDGDSPAPSTQLPAQGVGPGGGTVTGPTGAQVVVPPNALSQPTAIGIARSSTGAPALPAGFDVYGGTFEFTPHGTSFAVPVTVRVPFDSALVPAGAVPTIFKADAQGTWDFVAGATVDAGAVTAQVSSFSWFVVGVGTSVLVASSAPTTAQGLLNFTSVAVADVASQTGTRTVATLVGTTASGLPARLEVAFDRGTGANPLIQLNWGDTPESIVYCTPGSSNPCASVVVNARTMQIDILLGGTQLMFGADPNVRAVLRGPVMLGRGVLAPGITQQPADATVAAGLDATFTVTSTGTALAYQWQRSDDGGTTYSDIAGATGASYALVAARSAAPPAGDDSARFRVVVSNGAGSATSQAAVLTVTATPVPPVITAPPRSLAVPDGSIATFTVSASGTPPLTYEWHNNGLIVGTDSATLSFVAGAADNGAQIDVTVANAAGSVNSGVAILTVAAAAPPPLTAVRIAGGNRFTYARGNSGALYSWGSDAGEALGNGPGTAARNTPGPVSVVADAIALVKSYGSSGHGLAIRANGEVWGWGANQSGQLGHGTTVAAPVPAPMKDGNGATVTNVVAISGGVAHSLVLRADGLVLAAGANPGDGTANFRSFAAPVPGLTSIVAIASGAGSSYALRSDGTVWAWGDNTLGQLGDGTAIFRSSPAQVTGLAGVVGIAAGSTFALALDGNGDVWAWGTNASGQLGDGSNIASRPTPGKVTISGVAAVAVGEQHALALMTDGTLRAWGENAGGRLGVGDQADRSTPVAVPGLASVVAMAGGNSHSLAVLSDGRVFSWGSNVSGELGLGSTLSLFPTPQQVTGLNLN